MLAYWKIVYVGAECGTGTQGAHRPPRKAASAVLAGFSQARIREVAAGITYRFRRELSNGSWEDFESVVR